MDKFCFQAIGCSVMRAASFFPHVKYLGVTKWCRTWRIGVPIIHSHRGQQSPLCDSWTISTQESPSNSCRSWLYHTHVSTYFISCARFFASKKVFLGFFVTLKLSLLAVSQPLCLALVPTFVLGPTTRFPSRIDWKA